tara:strand:+ start:4977 stop:5504 length:528 start_codon:yes stop_codon:yes gene_type:complete
MPFDAAGNYYHQQQAVGSKFASTGRAYPGVGLNHVGSYQASARPWVNSVIAVPASGAVATAKVITFPQVSKFFTIVNNGNDELATAVAATIKIAFSAEGLRDDAPDAGAVRNFIELQASQSFSADFRITKLYVMASGSDANTHCSVIAGLTNIYAGHLSGSWAGEIGVDNTNHDG